MTRLGTAIRADLTVQGRHRFPHIYLAITVFYALLLRLTPLSTAVPALLPLLLFSEPGLLAMFFTAAQHFFERTQGVAVALAVTPLRVREYVLAKVVSISLLATAAGVLLTAIVMAPDGGLLALAPVLFLTAALSGFIGLALATYFTDFVRFLFAAGLLVQVPLFLPVLAVLELSPPARFIWLPSAPAWYALRLVVLAGPGAFRLAAYWWYLALLAAWAAAASAWTRRAYARRVRGWPGGCRRARGGAEVA